MGDKEVVFGSGVQENDVSGSVAPTTMQSEGQSAVYENENENSVNRNLWLWIGLAVFLVILFVGSFFIFTRDSVIEISEEEFGAGKSVDFAEKDRIEFKVGEEEHSISVDSVRESSVDIIIRSDVIKVSLNIGESKSFDLDGDDVDDLIIKLERIVDGEPVLFVREFIEDAKEEIASNIEADEGYIELEESVDVEINIVSNSSLDEEIIQNENFTCSYLGGYICDEDEICKGIIDSDASDGNFCCNIKCSANDENITAESVCAERGEYLYSEGDFCGGVLAEFYIYDVPVSCCSVPVSDLLVSSDELRITWDSIVDSGECGNASLQYSIWDYVISLDYISNLSSCSPYKCSYIHPFSQERVEKGIIGRYNGECHSLDEMPNNGELYCSYDDSQLEEVVEYFIFWNEHCGDGVCSLVYNESGNFIDGILTINPFQDMTDNGDCVASFA